ncbi:cardiolipin synthase [Halalkalibacter sp. AB-rgal2]|uniref:cardiolipin synthase n=1 Tax=Halalkalibacter sp. AB-rgal2 TaxID=3242695 RepID=UPI00359DB2A6
MNGWLIALFIIVALIILMRIDFLLGLRKQKKEATRHVQETRYGDVMLLTEGEECFKQMLHDMKEATDHIHILFYIFRDDHIGKKVLSTLALKAKQGVTVRLLVDRFGCKLSRHVKRKYKKAGISIAYSHPPSFPYLFFTINRRNHRKLTIIDGTVGYVGGFNVGDEYLGRDPSFGFWRDFHLRIAGEGVQDLQEQFLEDWQTAKQTYIKKESHYPRLTKGEVPLRILPTDGSYLEEMFVDLIRQAKSSIVIGTPYYIPGKLLQKELLNAAKRGINIRIVLPKKGDHPLVREAAYPYFERLLKEGVSIYQYYRGFFHAKCIIIDEQMCDIGTANFDKRSFHLNHEINCLIYEKAFVQKVLHTLEYDMQRSERLTLKAYEKRPFIHRSKEKIATLVSGLL